MCGVRGHEFGGFRRSSIEWVLGPIRILGIHVDYKGIMRDSLQNYMVGRCDVVTLSYGFFHLGFLHRGLYDSGGTVGGTLILRNAQRAILSRSIQCCQGICSLWCRLDYIGTMCVWLQRPRKGMLPGD